MQFIGDEVISATSGTVKTLTRSKIDNAGGSRATRAIIFNHSVSGNGTVGLRYSEDPDAADYEYEPLGEGESKTIDTYENLRDLKIKLTGDATAKLFCQYFN